MELIVLYSSSFIGHFFNNILKIQSFKFHCGYILTNWYVIMTMLAFFHGISDILHTDSMNIALDELNPIYLQTTQGQPIFFDN